MEEGGRHWMANKRWLIGSAVTLSLAALAAACTIREEAPASPEFNTDPTPPSKRPQDSTVDSGSSTGSSGSSGSSSGNTSTKTDGGDASTAPACFGDTGTLPKCEEGACKVHCDNYTEDYKKGLAAEIMKCHTKTQCNGDPNKCAETALKNACADATAATYCAGLVTACAGAGGDELTKTQCETLAKGLNATGRANFKYCLEQDGNACRYDSAQCYYIFL
jgi:hypothetical protein